jgi:hypothetical protein
MYKAVGFLGVVVWLGVVISVAHVQALGIVGNVIGARVLGGRKKPTAFHADRECDRQFACKRKEGGGREEGENIYTHKSALRVVHTSGGLVTTLLT